MSGIYGVVSLNLPRARRILDRDFRVCASNEVMENELVQMRLASVSHGAAPAVLAYSRDTVTLPL